MKSPGLRFVFVFGMAICLSTRAGSAAPQASSTAAVAERHFRAALQAQTSAHFDVAVREYQAVLRLQPRLAEAYGNLGLVYYLQSNFEQSAQALSKASALKPGLRGLDLLLGMDYVRLHHSEKAVPCLTRAAKAEPTNSEAQLWLGTALWNAGQRHAALQQLRKTARLFPTDVEALYALGEAYQKAASRQLEKLPPKYARMLLKGTRPPQWQESSALVPHKTRADPYRQTLADFDRKDDQAAEAELVPFLAAHPNDTKAHYLLARTYDHLSLSVLSRMYQANPNSYRVHQLLGRIYEDRWQNDKALAEYRIVERLRPALPGLHLVIGEVLWREEQLAPALTEFKAEIKVNPYDARPYEEMGTILVQQHQSAKAIPYLTRALQLQPDMLLVHKQLGTAYYQGKEYARAVQELKKALSIDHDGSVHYLLGAIYRDTGHPEEARAELQEARLIQTKSEREAEVTNENAARVKP
jgi:tetratricopeptide (TPR) repeat protein